MKQQNFSQLILTNRYKLPSDLENFEYDTVDGVTFNVVMGLILSGSEIYLKDGIPALRIIGNLDKIAIMEYCAKLLEIQGFKREEVYVKEMGYKRTIDFCANSKFSFAYNFLYQKDSEGNVVLRENVYDNCNGIRQEIGELALTIFYLMGNQRYSVNVADIVTSYTKQMLFDVSHLSERDADCIQSAVDRIGGGYRSVSVSSIKLNNRKQNCVIIAKDKEYNDIFFSTIAKYLTEEFDTKLPLFARSNFDKTLFDELAKLEVYLIQLKDDVYPTFDDNEDDDNLDC